GDARGRAAASAGHRRDHVQRPAVSARGQRRRERARACAGDPAITGETGVVSGTVGRLGATRRRGGRVQLRGVRPRERPDRARETDPPPRGDRERRRRNDAAAGPAADHGRRAMKVTKTYVRLLSADVPKTAAFYRRALGLVVRYESPSWTELSADGGIVALHDGGTHESTE